MKVYGRFTIPGSTSNYNVKSSEVTAGGHFKDGLGNSVDSFPDGVNFNTIMLQSPDGDFRFSPNVNTIPRWTQKQNSPYLSTAQDSWSNLFIDNLGSGTLTIELQMEVQISG